MYNGCREVDEHAQIQFDGRLDGRNHACGSDVSRRKTTQNNAKQQKKNRKCCIRLRRKSSSRPAPSCRIGASITDWVKIFAVARSVYLPAEEGKTHRFISPGHCFWNLCWLQQQFRIE